MFRYTDSIKSEPESNSQKFYLYLIQKLDIFKKQKRIVKLNIIKMSINLKSLETCVSWI